MNQSVFHWMSFASFPPFLILGDGVGETFSTSSECAQIRKARLEWLLVWVGFLADWSGDGVLELCFPVIFYSCLMLKTTWHPPKPNFFGRCFPQKSKLDKGNLNSFMSSVYLVVDKLVEGAMNGKCEGAPVLFVDSSATGESRLRHVIMLNLPSRFQFHNGHFMLKFQGTKKGDGFHLALSSVEVIFRQFPSEIMPHNEGSSVLWSSFTVDEVRSSCHSEDSCMLWGSCNHQWDQNNSSWYLWSIYWTAFLT